LVGNQRRVIIPEGRSACTFFLFFFLLFFYQKSSSRSSLFTCSIKAALQDSFLSFSLFSLLFLGFRFAFLEQIVMLYMYYKKGGILSLALTAII